VEQVELPQQSKESIICKEADTTDCNNYWAILFLSTAYKIVSSILLSVWGLLHVHVFQRSGQLLIMYCAFVEFLRNTGVKFGSVSAI